MPKNEEHEVIIYRLSKTGQEINGPLDASLQKSICFREESQQLHEELWREQFKMTFRE